MIQTTRALLYNEFNVGVRHIVSLHTDEKLLLALIGIALVIRWRNPPTAGEHRFAKLTLEIPRQPTFTHVFDADGDIDDFLELPLPASHE